MAKIVKSESAPAGDVRFSLGNVEFDLGESFESNDGFVLRNAEAHPWLEVEYDDGEVLQGTYYDRQVHPEDDVLSAVNSVANDPDEVRRAEAEKHETEVDRVAIESGLDQGEVVDEGPHGESFTLASVDDDNYEGTN